MHPESLPEKQGLYWPAHGSVIQKKEDAYKFVELYFQGPKPHRAHSKDLFRAKKKKEQYAFVSQSYGGLKGKVASLNVSS